MSRVLALDCGGSHCSCLVVGQDEVIVDSYHLPPGTLSTVGAEGIARTVADVVSRTQGIDAVTLGVAGARTAEDRRSIVVAIHDFGIPLPVAVYSDARCALAAAGLSEGIVLVAGTGSSAVAVDTNGIEVRAGGWGRWLGDEGGAYWIACRAIAAAARGLDEGDPTGRGLAGPFMDFFGLARFEEVRMLASDASRVGAVLPLVGDLAARGNEAAKTVVQTAAEELARLVALVAGSVPHPRRVAVAGGAFAGLPQLTELVKGVLGEKYQLESVRDDPALGAYRLAMSGDDWLRPAPGQALVPATERPNRATERIDRLSTADMLRLMNEEDARVAPAVGAHLGDIAKLVDAVVARLRGGGRLVYVGAGTSGRLAMLDAVECVPTFGTEPGEVVAVVAGGVAALSRAVEGAEDDEQAGRAAVSDLSIDQRDVVVGVSASGSAPFVRGALLEAAARHALTGLITCNPLAEAASQVSQVVCVEVGPEVITGSSRLKAGTSQKLVLNMVSTAVMVRLGRTRGNRMVGVRPTNRKLRDRAVRLVRELTGVDDGEARAALEATGWDITEAASAIAAGAGSRQTKRAAE